MLSADMDSAGAQMIGDTRWSMTCNGVLKQGTRARVVGSEGMTLVVEADV